MNNKYKLLVVEDEANIRSFMETILDTNGYKVMTAENCEQGIFMFLSHIKLQKTQIFDRIQIESFSHAFLPFREMTKV